MTVQTADREREKTRLAGYRDVADRLAGDVWELDVKGSVSRVIVRRSTGESVAICTIHADALAPEVQLLAGAGDLLAFFLALQDRAAVAVRELRGQLDRRERANRPASQVAAILCGKPAFQRFLEGRGAGGEVRTTTAADTRLKSLLRISSKKQLDEDASCAERFRRLREDYNTFKRGRS